MSCSASADASDTDGVKFFERSVLPLLQKHCFECHSHQAKSSEGGLMLDSRVGWETGGDSGPSVVPGEPDSSLLLKAVSYADDDLRMPPDGRLMDAEVAVFRQWIKDGAKAPRQMPKTVEHGDQHAKTELWSLKPLHVDDDPSQSIDWFIDERLTEAGLKPNAEADRAVLLRRASFDLTGLPPTPEEVDQFLQDEAPDAWMRLIDRLLSSPRYGERWGRHWLDLARYGDSNGGDINYAHANAWRYRDYVINSFNDDKPYDDFIREQLAGDLLVADEPVENRAELLTATGFLMLGPKMLSEVDVEKQLIDIVDEQLDVSGKTFLGMTFGCARCHDHKFDPISIRDYYGMAGIFRSTKIMEVLRPKKDVAEWVEVDVTPPNVRQEIDTLNAEREKLASELDTFGDAKGLTGNPNSAGRAVVVSDLPTLRSTTWAARVRIDVEQNLGAVISADYNGAGQGHSLGFDRINNGRVPRVVWNHAKATTIITANSPVSLGQWHHLAVTYNADTKRLALYVNGELAAAAEDVASTPFSTVGVGRREASKEFQLLGDVDEVVVYDTALSQEEVVVLDAGQILTHRPVFQWDFEKVQDDEVIDTIGHHTVRLVGLRPDSNIIADGFQGKGLTLRSRATLSEADQQHLAEVRNRMKAINEIMPDSITVMAVQAGKPVDLPVHVRGNHTNLSQDIIPRTTPVVFESNLAAIKVAPPNNGRLELANWIVHPDNPLTARVMVNRVWQHHFGQGLVRTPSNFGHRGNLPSHPRLLDWLANEFVESGWSIKHMHRLIMMSNAYRRSSDHYADASRTDPENRLLARFTVRRLEAEAIRDALLAVSGELKLGSPGSLMTSPNMKRVAMTPTDPAYESLSRGVYLPMIRVRGYEMFSIFDVADNGQHVDVRPQTMVAQQALFLLNNPFVSERAKQVAARVSSRDETDAVNMEWLYRLMFARSPSPTESELLRDYSKLLRESRSESAAWQALAHSLFCSNEFIHIR